MSFALLADRNVGSTASGALEDTEIIRRYQEDQTCPPESPEVFYAITRSLSSSDAASVGRAVRAARHLAKSPTNAWGFVASSMFGMAALRLVAVLAKRDCNGDDEVDRAIGKDVLVTLCYISLDDTCSHVICQYDGLARVLRDLVTSERDALAHLSATLCCRLLCAASASASAPPSASPSPSVSLRASDAVPPPPPHRTAAAVALTGGQVDGMGVGVGVTTDPPLLCRLRLLAPVLLLLIQPYRDPEVVQEALDVVVSHCENVAGAEVLCEERVLRPVSTLLGVGQPRIQLAALQILRSVGDNLSASTLLRRALLGVASEIRPQLLSLRARLQVSLRRPDTDPARVQQQFLMGEHVPWCLDFVPPASTPGDARRGSAAKKWVVAPGGGGGGGGWGWGWGVGRGVFNYPRGGGG